MIITATTLAATSTAVSAVFAKALMPEEKDSLDKLYTSMTTDKGNVTLTLLAGVPGMGELIGDAKIDDLAAASSTVDIKKYASTISIKEEDIQRDNLNAYTPAIEAMGEEARYLPGELVVDLLNQGFSANDYTGSPFFSTVKNHLPGIKGSTLKSPQFANKGTKKLSTESLTEAIANLKERCNPYGKSMNLGRRGLLLVVPPALEMTARKIVAVNQDENEMYGAAEIAVLNGLESKTAWFLMDVSKAMKPFVRITEVEPHLLNTMGQNSDYFIMKHEYLFQAFGRLRVSYGIPQYAYGSTGATA